MTKTGELQLTDLTEGQRTVYATVVSIERNKGRPAVMSHSDLRDLNGPIFEACEELVALGVLREVLHYDPQLNPEAALGFTTDLCTTSCGSLVPGSRWP